MKKKKSGENLIKNELSSLSSSADIPSLAQARLYGSESLLNYCDLDQDSDQETADRSSIDMVLDQALFKCSYIIEPVAFIQNLAASIMGISVSQFIYNRIYDRLLSQATHNSTVPLGSSLFQSYNSCVTSNSSGNVSLLNNYINTFDFSSIRSSPQFSYHSSGLSISPADLDIIRNKAQAETANLYYLCSLYSGIPVILMTLLLGANCSVLGRKTLIVFYLLSLSTRYIIFLLQCLFPLWPDWLFYLGAFIEGISGSYGVFLLSLYCYLSDLTPIESRAYRITLLNSMNSIASLCVTYLCGYVIKYYGYFYLFLSSVILLLIALVYTICLVPETLIELNDKSMIKRFKYVSISRSINCFKVFFVPTTEERSPLLGNSEQKQKKVSTKQTLALILVVLANFVYCFGINGIYSVFTLFIMNAPFCFGPIEISQYSVFSTVVSLVVSLLVSRFLKINEVLICALSVASCFISVFCFIYGNSEFYIYLASVISSINTLSFSYVRSIVSKSVDKSKVSDAFSSILIVDTSVGVLSSIIYPILYAKFVSTGLGLFFAFSGGFVLIALVINM